MNRRCALSKTLIRGLCLAAAAAPIVSVHSSAQQLIPRAFPQVDVESYTFTSTVTGRDYDVTVGYPVGYDPTAEITYPALIVTDGNRFFPQLHGVVRGMSEQESRSLFVVSIGTPFELGQDAYVRRRVHEFSPPNWDMDDAFGAIVRDVCGAMEAPEPNMPCVGGSPKFLEFIATDLLPVLLAAYPIDPEQLGLFGISAGGFFAAWAIFQEISPFKTYIISSPAMAYGDGEILRQEARWAETHDDLNVSIYMASGSLEIDDPMMEGTGQIVSGHARLSGLLKLRNYPGLVLHSEIHQGFGHVDAGPLTLVRAMRLLYHR